MKRKKPSKPTKDFPLYPHPSGQWAKSILGKKRYFGVWEDPETALRNYHALMAGDQPTREIVVGRATVLDICDKLMETKEAAVNAGELSRRQFDDLKVACELAMDHLGAGALVNDLGPSDFAPIRRALELRFKTPSGIGSRIANVRSIFNHAANLGICKPVAFGNFCLPSRTAFRRHRAESSRKNGLKFFTWLEVALLLNAASPTMRAMILLGLNAGLNPADCKTLQKNDINGSWLGYYRRKSATDRRAWLWPQTTHALRELPAINPAKASHSNLMFLTRYGNPWGAVESSGCPLTHRFRKLLDAAQLYRRGHSFGALRSTYRTHADETKDFPAVLLTMGHVDPSISSDYRQFVGDDRLKAISIHVQSRIFPTVAEKT